MDPPPPLLSLAAQQAGVLTREQVSGFGLGRHSVGRLMSQGRWQRLAVGLYFTSPAEPSWLAFAWGGVFLGGDRACLGGQAAAHLHQLQEEPSQLIIWTSEANQRKNRPPWVFRRDYCGLRRTVGEPPRTSVEDTILDLCAGAGDKEVIHLVTSAVQNRRTTPERLRRRMAERGRMSHRALLLDLVEDVAEGAESPLELAYLRAAERPHGLPRGQRQHRSRHTRHCRDVWYQQYRTVVELDGRLGHEGAGRFRDMRFDNLGILSGEVTLRFGWSDVRERPCAIAWQVGAVLQQRGWSGQVARCRNCRLVPTPDFQ